MSKDITSLQMQFIAEKLLDNARDAVNESKKDGSKDDKLFYAGKKLAYYEMLDTMKNQLIVDDCDLKDFGLDINLEQALA